MKIKTIVTFALVFAMIAAGNIILFGLADGIVFPVFHFVLSVVVLVLLILVLVKVPDSAGDMVLYIVLIIVFSASFAFFAAEIKTYNEKYADLAHLLAVQSHEVDSMSSQNDYYDDFIKYQEQQIERYKQQSSLLQSQIDSISTEQPAVVFAPVQDSPDMVIVPDEYDDDYQNDDREDEGHDDDREEGHGEDEDD